MNNPVFHAMNPRPPAYNPNATRVTFEQPNNPYNQQPPPAPSPYDDYCRALASCSESTQVKIIQDEQFQARYEVCEALIKQALYATIIPDVLQTADGRLAFEELLAATQRLKEKYAQEAVNKEKETEILAQKLQERDMQVELLTSKMQQFEEMFERLAMRASQPAPEDSNAKDEPTRNPRAPKNSDKAPGDAK